MDNFKESWGKMSKRNKIALIGIVAATVIIAAAAIVYLSLSSKTKYSTLFTGLSTEEASQVAGLLQDEEIQYTYNASDGSIRVQEDKVESTRVSLLSKGYPKSGFTYDMYISNAGLMTTESDKELYTLYDLQDRLGATIRIFEGVQDAKVTIAQGSDDKFALSTTETIDASASVVVTMKDGATLSEANANAIRNLISRSVKGVNFTNVSVFDADTMEEIGGDTSGDTSKAIQDLTTQVENNIAANIKRVLGKLYGAENIAVSVKGTLDMTKLISEYTQYTVPDQPDESENRTGLLDHEDYNMENSGSTADGAAGVVGTDANADTPRYTNQNGTNTTVNGYSANAYSREWLFNQLKEQKEISPGVLKDATVAVVIMTDDTSVQQKDLVNLVADAGGIPRTDAADKITIIRSTKPSAAPVEEVETSEEEEPKFPLPALIVAIASAVLLLLILILFILRRRKKKRLAAEAAAAEAAAAEAAAAEAAALAAAAEEAKKHSLESDYGAEDDTNAAMQHGMRLKQNIGDFVDNNPQVVAKLIQGWLREDEEAEGESNSNGRRRDRSSRK